jgi:O-antigen ligase
MTVARLRLPGLERNQGLLVPAAGAATAAASLLAASRIGIAGLLLPVAVLATVVLISRPLLAFGLVVGLTIVCEGPSFGILAFSSKFYTIGFKYLTLQDALVAIALVASAREVVRSHREVWLPRALCLPWAILALAMVAGVVTGHAGGASTKFLLASEHALAYLLLVPIALANLDIDRARITRLLGALGALAVVKAILGLIEVAGHYGQPVEGAATLTYYEPAPDWLIMIALLTVVAALITRAKAPRWLSVSSVLLLACTALSYRRSFWIGTALGIVLVMMLGSTPAGRRLLIQAVTSVAVAIVLIGSVKFQSQLPLAKRVASLNPSKLEANREDRYRLDERANVLGAIREHPITGLGMTVDWSATVRPLPVEHEEGRGYVHFAVLWYWLKLGILGLFAYLAVLAGSMVLAWQAWRSSPEPLLRAFALASLAGLCGLVAIETTATFTGVEPRFTLLLATQVGVLALLARGSEPAPEPTIPARARPAPHAP